MKKVKAAATPPRLLCFAGLWGITEMPQYKKLSRVETMKLAKKAGFDGVMVGADGEMIRETIELGLERMSGISCGEKDFPAHVIQARATHSKRVNVQFYDHDTPPKEAVRGWIKLEGFAEELGVTVDLEVHRDTCTETPEKTWEIADRYQDITGRMIRFNFDFSHFALVKHIGAPYANRLLDRPELIQNSGQFHLRAFNGHHCQIAVLDHKGKLTPEGKDYLDFVDALLRCWLKGSRPGNELCIMPEQLTWAGYNVSGFPPVWPDMLAIIAQARETWDRVTSTQSRR